MMAMIHREIMGTTTGRVTSNDLNVCGDLRECDRRVFLQQRSAKAQPQ